MLQAEEWTYSLVPFLDIMSKKSDKHKFEDIFENLSLDNTSYCTMKPSIHSDTSLHYTEGIDFSIFIYFLVQTSRN